VDFFLKQEDKKAKKQNLDDQVYEELKHLETTKLKTHYWYWATQKLEPTEFKNKLCNATDYWINRLKLGKETILTNLSVYDCGTCQFIDLKL
jgi:hypothetical protein